MSDAAPSRLRRWQRMSLITAGVSCLLGFLTAGGCGPLPLAEPSSAAWIHPLLLLVGALAGWAAELRFDEIDHERWEIVGDAHLTKGEREYAHKEAERQRRAAGTAFVAAPLGLSFWFAYQFQGKFQWPDVTPADFLMLTPLLAFGLSLLITRKTRTSNNPK